MGKSVLLTSYTHSPWTRFLLKLKSNSDIKFLRLGRSSRIHSELQAFSADAAAETIGDLSELKRLFSECPIVATTCLGLNHPAVLQRQFDYCIIDEAGRATLLSALGPLFYASKFVLVGDPQQLPPVVQSETAREMGLENSLFTHLATKDNTIPLNIQYRMNSTVMKVANELVYDGQLESGSETISNRVLNCAASSDEADRPWMKKVMSDK